MKKLLVAVIGAIIAVGALSTSLIMGYPDNISTMSVNPLQSSARMLGHVTLTAYDENGNIKAYRQTDNVITNQLDDCLQKLAFAGVTGSGCTTTVAQGMFNKMAIGSGSPTTSEAQDSLATYISGPQSSTGFDSAALTQAAGTGGSSLLITSTFRPGASATVTEAAIQNSSVTDGTATEAAFQKFTGISLGSSDTLTIQWTIAIDGS
jgi:hypothetical protein